MPTARIYVDANVFKFSATRLLRMLPREERFNWGGASVISTVYHPTYINPNDRIRNPELRKEVDLLPQVAALAPSGIVVFFINIETGMEAWGLPSTDSETGKFYVLISIPLIPP